MLASISQDKDHALAFWDVEKSELIQPPVSLPLPLPLGQPAESLTRLPLPFPLTKDGARP